MCFARFLNSCTKSEITARSHDFSNLARILNLPKPSFFPEPMAAPDQAPPAKGRGGRGRGRGQSKTKAPPVGTAAGYNPKARVGNYGIKPPEPPVEFKKVTADDDVSVAMLGLRTLYEREFLAAYLQLNGDYFIKNVSLHDFSISARILNYRRLHDFSKLARILKLQVPGDVPGSCLPEAILDQLNLGNKRDVSKHRGQCKPVYFVLLSPIFKPFLLSQVFTVQRLRNLMVWVTAYLFEVNGDFYASACRDISARYDGKDGWGGPWTIAQYLKYARFLNSCTNPEFP